MALWSCEDCSTLFAVGLEVCPNCGSVNHREEGSTVEPKKAAARRKPAKKTGSDELGSTTGD